MGLVKQAEVRRAAKGQQRRSYLEVVDWTIVEIASGHSHKAFGSRMKRRKEAVGTAVGYMVVRVSAVKSDRESLRESVAQAVASFGWYRTLEVRQTEMRTLGGQVVHFVVRLAHVGDVRGRLWNEHGPDYAQIRVKSSMPYHDL